MKPWMVALFLPAPLGCEGRDESFSLSFTRTFVSLIHIDDFFLDVRELRREVFPSLAPSLEKKKRNVL